MRVTRAATMRKRGRKKRHVAVHTVSALLKVQGLSKAGSSLELEVSNTDGKLGTLVIGRGSITWLAKNKKKGRRRSWTAFAEWMATA
jgi:hypothetical protein